MDEKQYIVIGLAKIRHYEDPDEVFLITRFFEENEIGNFADEYFLFKNDVGIYASGSKQGECYNKYGGRKWREEHCQIGQWGEEEFDFDEVDFKEVYEMKANASLLLIEDFVSPELKLKIEVFKNAESKDRNYLLEQKERELYQQLKLKYGN